jgi:hypothetical protein
MPATGIRGTQATGNVNTSQHVRDVADRLVYLDPEASPFTLTLSQERAEKAENFKFEWAEKGGDFAGAGFAPKLDQVNNGAGYASGATSIVVDNGSYFNVGDTVKVVRTAEVMRVTAIATNTLTVVRGVGSTAAAALVDNDDLFIIGPSIAEGASVGVGNDYQEQWKFDYTQIYRHVAEATETQQWVKNYIGQPRTRLRREKAVEHKVDIERSFLFGERNRDTSTPGAPINYTGGFLYWATANAKNAGGTLTESEIWSWCESLFAHTASGPTRTLFASALVCSVIDLLAGARLQTVPKDETYGIAVKEWLTSHGRLLIVKHRLLETGAGGQGYGGYGLAADMRQLRYRYGRNTQLLTDRQAPGDDKWTDEYLTECGLEFKLPAVHGVLTGVTG